MTEAVGITDLSPEALAALQQHLELKSPPSTAGEEDDAPDSAPEHGAEPTASDDTGHTLISTQRGDGLAAVEIRQTAARGRGVFAASQIARGDLLERAPCILVPKREYEEHARHTAFEHYLFTARASRNSLLALGIGSLFNHSSRPNVDYRVHEETLTIDSFAARDVPAGEELCIYYGPDEELWFDVK